MIQANPQFMKTEAGDMAERLKLKDRLKCKDLDWFVDEVYPELRDQFFPRKDEL